MPSYPSTLPQPNKNGFRLAPKEANITARSESGTRRIRRKVTTEIYTINCSLSFKSKAEFDEFLKWLKYETNYGNLWFNANWFSDIGFTAGSWVFRFHTIPFSHSGWSQKHNVVILIGPKNDNNVVPGVYKEIGVGGEFIDQSYPFGYDIAKCTDDLTFNRIAYVDGDNFLRVFDWNGSNFTKVGQDYTLPTFSTFGLTYLKNDLVAYIDRNSTGTGNYGGPGAKLQAYSFNNDVWVAVGSNILIGAGDSVDYVCATALSSTRIAVAYARTAFFGSREVKLATYDFNGSSWSLVGSVFTVTSAGLTPTITRLSATRVALSYQTSGALVKLGTFDFSGTVWSLTGTLFSSGTLTNFPSVSALSSTKIAFADANYTLRSLTFSGSVWSLDANTFPTAGDNVSVIASDKVAVVHGALGKITMFKLTAGVWTQLGNEYYDNIGTLYPKICTVYVV